MHKGVDRVETVLCILPFRAAYREITHKPFHPVQYDLAANATGLPPAGSRLRLPQQRRYVRLSSCGTGPCPALAPIPAAGGSNAEYDVSEVL